MNYKLNVWQKFLVFLRGKEILSVLMILLLFDLWCALIVTPNSFIKESYLGDPLSFLALLVSLGILFYGGLRILTRNIQKPYFSFEPFRFLLIDLEKNKVLAEGPAFFVKKWQRCLNVKLSYEWQEKRSVDNCCQFKTIIKGLQVVLNFNFCVNFLSETNWQALYDWCLNNGGLPENIIDPLSFSKSNSQKMICPDLVMCSLCNKALEKSRSEIERILAEWVVSDLIKVTQAEYKEVLCNLIDTSSLKFADVESVEITIVK